MSHRLPCRTRRQFVKTAASGLALAGAACAGIPVLVTRAVDGRISVDRGAYPELATPGKGIVVRSEEAGEPIVLVAVGNDEFRALSGVCTHLACTVRLSGRGLSCPCHGSTFSLEGRVTRGPAPADLHTYPTTVSGDAIVITLN